MDKNSRIYVAGHTGLLGSALLKRLQGDGYKNIIKRTHGELDLTVQSSVESFFKEEKPDYVFLAAGLTGGITANRDFPATFLHTNIAMQDNVFEAAQRHGVRHLVFYGSSCIYPRQCPQPMKEEHLFTGVMEETSEAYAAAKLAGIKASKAYNGQYGTKRFIALVPNSMYGPNDNFSLENSHVLSALMRKIHDAAAGGEKSISLWGSGSPRREFVFSEDVADASVFAVNNADRLENAFYNVGAGADCSIKELAGHIRDITGFKGEIKWDASKPDGAPRKLLDGSRFNSLGWRPKTGFIEGLRATYEWFLGSQAEKRPS